MSDASRCTRPGCRTARSRGRWRRPSGRSPRTSSRSCGTPSVLSGSRRSGRRSTSPSTPTAGTRRRRAPPRPARSRAAAQPVDADQILAFRLARSGLASREGRDLAAAAACPASDFARDAALIALAARTEDVSRASYDRAVDSGELTVAHIVRGAIHALAPDDLALYGRALIARDDDELGVQLGRQVQRLSAEKGFAPGDALAEVATATKEALARGRTLDKNELHEELRQRVSADLMPWCRGCASHHVAPMLWRYVEDELAEVSVGKAKAWLLSADAGELESPPAADGVRLIPAGDPYLQKPNRPLLAPNADLRKRLFRPVASPGAVLKDGRLVGLWRSQAKGKRTEISVDKLGRLARKDLENEARRVAEVRGAGDVALVVA